MPRIYNISILMSFFGLWVTSAIPSEFEILFGMILILTFGILHGSNDILLIETISNKKSKNPLLRVLMIYLIIVLSAVIIFYFVPIVGLILFIIFSAFHFGEQHWENKALPLNKILRQIFYLSYGWLILMLLFVFNIEDVKDVVESITKYNISEDFIKYNFLFSASIFFILFTYITYRSRILKSKIIIEIFFLGIFAILFKVSTLIWGFTIYFIFWHSIPSLFEQVNFIYGNFNKKSLFQYSKNAFPYWLISLIGMGIMYFIFKDEQLLYAILFSFIAAITFPHSLVMNKMFENKKTQSNK